MEIERKWLLKELPKARLVEHGFVEQFYVSVEPEVRLRRSEVLDGKERIPYRLAIKGNGTLVREEIQVAVPQEFYEQVRNLIGKDPISKEVWTFNLDGYKLEVSKVENQFLYAEIEFDTVEQANAYVMPLVDAVEVTNDPAYKMKNYWRRTRLA